MQVPLSTSLYPSAVLTGLAGRSLQSQPQFQEQSRASSSVSMGTAGNQDQGLRGIEQFPPWYQNVMSAKEQAYYHEPPLSRQEGFVREGGAHLAGLINQARDLPPKAGDFSQAVASEHFSDFGRSELRNRIFQIPTQQPLYPQYSQEYQPYPSERSPGASNYQLPSPMYPSTRSLERHPGFMRGSSSIGDPRLSGWSNFLQ